jgi:hypothetical protein
MNKFEILVNNYLKLLNKNFLPSLERDIATLQTKLKESKKVTLREPTPPPPTVTTQSRLAQTDPWTPPSPPIEKSDDGNKEFQAMMQTKIEALERKYQTIIEQKNSQIQQLMQEVRQFKNRTKSFLNFIFRMTLNKKHLKLKWKDM